MSLDTSHCTKRLLFFTIDGQKCIGTEYTVTFNIQMDFEFSSFLHRVVSTALPELAYELQHGPSAAQAGLG